MTLPTSSPFPGVHMMNWREGRDAPGTASITKTALSQNGPASQSPFPVALPVPAKGLAEPLAGNSRPRCGRVSGIYSELRVAVNGTRRVALSMKWLLSLLFDASLDLGRGCLLAPRPLFAFGFGVGT